MTLDSKFAAGMREQLVDTAAGTSTLAVHTRRVRLGMRLMIGAGAIGLLTAGALIAASVIPGNHVITGVGETITQSHVGSATVELGPRPETANAVSYVLTCTSAGIITTYTAENEWGSMPCGPFGAVDPLDPTGGAMAPIGSTMTVEDQLLAPGATSFSVTADPGMTWTVTARYVNTRTTDWGVNANGQTYGVSNERGIPDLEAVYASNCAIGYIYSNAPTSEGHSIPVYESDGETVIGEFWIGSGMPFCHQR